MVLPQAMAWVQYWFRVLSLKFCGKSKKICGDISQVSPAFCIYAPRYRYLFIFSICKHQIQLLVYLFSICKHQIQVLLVYLFSICQYQNTGSIIFFVFVNTKYRHLYICFLFENTKIQALVLLFLFLNTKVGTWVLLLGPV